MKPELIEIWEKHGEIVSTVQARACLVSHKRIKAALLISSVEPGIATAATLRLWIVGHHATL